MGQYRIAHNNSVPPRPNYWTCPGTHPPPTFLYTTWDHLAGPLLLLASLKYAYSHCVLSSFLSCVRCRCWLIFVFLLFLPFFDFDLDSVCFHPVFFLRVIRCLLGFGFCCDSFSILVWYQICILIRTYVDRTFLFFVWGIRFVSVIVCIIFCFYLFSSWGNFPLQSYWSLSCDHGLHCSDELMREQVIIWGGTADRG